MKVAILAGFALLPAVAVCGDNAAMTSGGALKMLSAHPSVVMADEIVLMNIRSDRVLTDCTFQFRNTGTACKVRMGFPDFGMFALSQTKSQNFVTYQSYVNGKAVPSKFETTKAGEGWHTKTVSFPSKGTVTVREVYTSDLGGAMSDYPLAMAAYVLRTGASWKGNIGHARIAITFDPDLDLGSSLRSNYATISNAKSLEDVKKLTSPRGAVMATGPCKPTVDGATITFERSNWRPTKEDDVYIVFAMSKVLLDRMMKEIRERMKHKGLGGD